MVRAQYEIKYVADGPAPRYLTTWLTQEGRDRLIKSMSDRGWDIIRVTRQFQSGLRAA